MTSLAVVVETTDLEAVADRLLLITAESIGQASLRAVNSVAQRGFTESVRRMTSRVNLTESYVRERMDVEPANNPRNVEAKIIAFRAGGRRAGTRPTNLRQYAAVQVKTPVRWPNSTPQIAKDQWGKNPRKSGAFLKWKRRTGAPHLGIEVGQKQAGVSVEVLKGSRKTLGNAFFAAGRKGREAGGNGLLVFERVGGNGPGKGKIQALYSLSVWQLFRRTSAQVIPFVRDDLNKTIGDEVLADIEKTILT